MSGENFQVGQSLRERFEAGEIFVPFPRLTWLDIAGADRAQVLGNLTTNNIKTLDDGQGVETFITDVRGKTFGHGLVFSWDGRLRMLTVADQFQRLSAHIDRYVIREDVQVEERTADLHTLYWPGVSGAKLARKLNLQPAAFPQLAAQAIELEGVSAMAYQVPWTRHADWLFVVAVEQADELDAALIAHDILPGAESIVHCGRINHKFPWFGLDCQETNLPQEMDRDAAAIDFRKGCYLGQETIARLDAMGQVQKKLTLWRFTGDQVPPVGMELRSGDKVVATVTSGTFCFDHGAPLALCMARRSHFDVGSRAESPIGPAEVINGVD